MNKHNCDEMKKESKTIRSIYGKDYPTPKIVYYKKGNGFFLVTEFYPDILVSHCPFCGNKLENKNE